MMFADTLIRAATFPARFGLAAAATPTAFDLSSPDFTPGGTLDAEQAYDAFGCTGKNVSPALRWTGAPANAKSFALLMHDPDAPTGGAGWWHWVVYDLPAATRELPKGAGKVDGSKLPQGASSATTDYGTTGYGGPCPPEGDPPHRYEFTLHALDVETLEVPKGATASLVGYLINAHSIAKANLTGKFGRKRR